MFSTTEYEYLDNLVKTYILKLEYKDYVCTTISNSETEDFRCYFSREDIIANSNYNFSLPEPHSWCSVDSSTYSTYNQNPKIECFAEEPSTTITINDYENIYTNIDNTIHADILSEFYYQKQHDVSYNVDLNYMYFIGLLLLLPIIIGFTRKFFRI